MRYIPKISVIIPVRNEQPYITRCIESVFLMNGIDRCEVLVVDGMSEDGTRTILAGFQKTRSNLRVIDNPKKIVTTALNIAIGNALGEYIIRCDAHAVYTKDYLSSCIEIAEKTGAANVGGHMRAVSSRPALIAQAIALSHYSKFGLGGGRFHDPDYEGYVETVWLGCYRREVLKQIGPYNESLPRSEDIDLNSRLIKAGYKIYLSSKIKAYYFCRPDLISLWRQRWADGTGIIQSVRLNARAVRLRHYAPLFGVCLCIAVIVWTLAALMMHHTTMLRWAFATACIGAGIYLCASLYFTVCSAFKIPHINAYIHPDISAGVKIQKGAFLLLPVVFPTLHFSYGFGSIAGLLKRG